MKTKALMTTIMLTLFLASMLSMASVDPVFAVPPAPVLLDPKTIPKFVNQLTGPPPVYAPTVVTDKKTGQVLSHDYTVDASQFTQQILPPPLPGATVWGYGGMVQTPSGPTYFQYAPGATFEATRGIPVNVQWVNKLTGPHMFVVDPTLHWANPNNIPMMLMPPFPPFPPFPP